jgi:hypothetical protein
MVPLVKDQEVDQMQRMGEVLRQGLPRPSPVLHHFADQATALTKDLPIRSGSGSGSHSRAGGTTDTSGQFSWTETIRS